MEKQDEGIVKIFCKNKSTNLKKCEFGFNFKQNFLIFKLLSGRVLPRHYLTVNDDAQTKKNAN